jgi:hypothetical protein
LVIWKSRFFVIARATRPKKQRAFKPGTHLAFSWHTLKLSSWIFETIELR